MENVFKLLKIFSRIKYKILDGGSFKFFGDSKMITQKEFGPWQLNISDEIETVPAHIKAGIEGFINHEYLSVAMSDYKKDYSCHNFAMTKWGVPAPVIRLDMAPCSDGEEVSIYEVEANIAGPGIMRKFFPESNFSREVGKALLNLGISKVGYTTTPCRKEQWMDLSILMSSLREEGIETKNVNIYNGESDDFPLWLRSGQEDIELISPLMNRCLLLHHHGGGHKNYLRSLSGAFLLSEFSSVDEVFDRFPDGFVLKPFGGWGTRDVYIWATRRPWREKSRTKTSLNKKIGCIFESNLGMDWLVQPFNPPRFVNGMFRIWRLFAVWDGSEFKIIDSFWSERNSLLNHGASDTIIGSLRV